MIHPRAAAKAALDAGVAAFAAHATLSAAREATYASLGDSGFVPGFSEVTGTLACLSHSTTAFIHPTGAVLIVVTHGWEAGTIQSKPFRRRICIFEEDRNSAPIFAADLVFVEKDTPWGG